MAGETTTTQDKRRRGRPRKHPKKTVAKKVEKVEPKKTSTPKTTAKKTETKKVEKPTEIPVEEKVEKVEKVETAPIEEKEEVTQDVEIEEVISETEEHMEEATVSGFDIDESETVGSDYSPLSEPVIMRGYEGGNNPIANEESEARIPTAQLTYEDDIPAQAEAEAVATATEQPAATTNNGQSSFSTNGSHQAQNSGFSAASQTQKTEEKKSFWDNSHSSHAETTTESPAEKKKNATKMADTLLMLYQSNVPSLFQFVAKFNEGKISRMELNGEIDLLMPVMEDGTTVGQYIQRVNMQVENTFVITDDMVAEVREPLIDYLMEKDFKMTPSQRLLAAVIGQMFTLGISAFAQWRQNRHALNQFAEFTMSYKQQNGGGRDIPTQAQAQPQQQTSAEDAAHGYEAVEEEEVHGYTATEQASTPYSNLSDLDGAENQNLMAKREDEVISVEVEEIPHEEEGHLDLNSYLHEEEEPMHNEDIPM